MQICLHPIKLFNLHKLYKCTPSGQKTDIHGLCHPQHIILTNQETADFELCPSAVSHKYFVVSSSCFFNQKLKVYRHGSTAPPASDNGSGSPPSIQYYFTK